MNKNLILGVLIFVIGSFFSGCGHIDPLYLESVEMGRVIEYQRTGETALLRTSSGYTVNVKTGEKPLYFNGEYTIVFGNILEGKNTDYVTMMGKYNSFEVLSWK